MNLIPVGRELFAKVDDGDFDLVSQFRWCPNPRGRTIYAISYVAGKTLSMHREILLPPKGLVVDHINHDGLDNRRENMRVVTQSQNRQWSRTQGSATGYRGVFRNGSRYAAMIRADGRTKYIGTFSASVDAAHAYDAAALALRGVFAKLNFPTEAA